ncbi:MAG: hypothetical protein KAS23_09940 [Anaerohalosphaera sp.]|nr:hypothetical protein [Anaerohalosphaera sp.]
MAIGAGVAGSFLGSSEAKAETFYDFCAPHSYAKSITSRIDYEAQELDNLTYRTDPNDASGASDIFVPKEGYEGASGHWVGEVWRVALLKKFYNDQEQFQGWDFVGYADNDNVFSNPYPEQAAGWLGGKMYNNWGTMPAGTKPDDMFVVDDKNGDGVGTVENGQWHLGEDDVLYSANDVLIASGPGKTDFRRGDVSSLPVYPYDSRLPNMIISPHQEGDAVFLEGKRIDSEGYNDLVNFAEHWLTDGHGAHNYWANGADQNTDGKVDLTDFSIMAKNWKPE